jgi:hypothetical protein
VTANLEADGELMEAVLAGGAPSRQDHGG